METADLNIEAVHHLMSSDHLKRCHTAVASSLAAVGARQQLDAQSADRYLRAIAAPTFSTRAEVGIEAYLCRLQDSATYQSMAKFTEAVEVVDCAYRLVSAACYPSVLTRHKLDVAANIWDPASLRQVVETPDGTPLSEWLRRRVTKLIEEHRPDLFGVSLTFPDQMLLTFIALSAARNVDPTIHTCLGGATATRLGSRLNRLGPLLGLIDTVVLGEGEMALLKLADRVARRAPPERLDNVIWRAGDDLIKGSTGAIIDMDELPTPDYAAMPLDTYLVPEPVLLLNGSRACYWGRCSFCDVSGTATERYRERSLDRVVADIRCLRESCGARHIMFGDLAISPVRLEQLANRLIEEKLDVSWLCQARLEPGFTRERIHRLAQGGCRGLVFGLETASQRMLNRMVKGTRFRDAEPTLRACSEANIAVNLQTFIGFPGETEEEARETVRFVVSQRDSVTSVALTSFKLIEGTAAYEHAPSLGLRELRQAEGTLDVLWDYSVDEGLHAKTADRLVKELQEKIRVAFPAVEHGLSWNAYALLLAALGGTTALRDFASDTGSGDALHFAPELRLVQLPYHVGELAALVHEADPDRSLQGVRQNRLRGHHRTVRRRPTWTVLDSRLARAIPLDNEMTRLVQSCDGRQSAAALLSSAEDKPRAAASLLQLLKQGVLVPGPRIMEMETLQ